MGNISKELVDEALARLKLQGFVIEHGLDSEELSDVENAFGALLPVDLRLLLEVGCIRAASGSDQHSPDWRNPGQEANRAQEWIKRAFSFDIKQGQYWSEQFGPKPKTLDLAVGQALSVVSTWPKLFPIFGHRFIPSNPHESGTPVISLWQAVDSIYYGSNVIDYLNKEFKLGLNIAECKPAEVPYWGEALDLHT